MGMGSVLSRSSFLSTKFPSLPIHFSCPYFDGEARKKKKKKKRQVNFSYAESIPFFFFAFFFSASFLSLSN